MKNNNFPFLHVLCVASFVFCLAGTGSSARGAVASIHKLKTVEVVIDDANVVSKDLMGVGYNVGPLWIPNPTLGDDQELTEFFDLLADSKTPWIRMMLSYYEWECKVVNGEHPVYENDDDDPWTSPKKFLSDDSEGFIWNTNGGLDWRIRYVLDFCEKNDIQVEVNNWETWMKRWLDHEKDHQGIISYEEALGKAHEFGENFASLIYYLKTKANKGKGYDCVKYYALWNEPGGGYPNQDFVSFDFPGYLNLLYKTVQEHLVFYDKEMDTSVCQQLESIGFESFAGFRNSSYSGHPMEEWTELLGKGVLQYLEPADKLPGEIKNWPDGDAYMDIISIHEYWIVFDYDKNNPHPENKGTINDRLISRAVADSIRQISQYDIDKQMEPLIIGEVGAKSYLPDGEKLGSEANYSHMLCLVESYVRSFQSGLKGGSMWAWNMHSGYAAVSYPGCWWEVEPLGEVHPINANYYPYILLTRFVERGSDALSTKVVGGIDDSKGSESWPVVKTQRVWASAFRSQDSRINLIVVNDSYEAYELDLDSENIKASQKYFVTAEKYDQLYVQNITATDSQKNILPARSICVFVCEN